MLSQFQDKGNHLPAVQLFPSYIGDAMLLYTYVATKLSDPYSCA